MSELLETISQWLKRVVTQPLGELDRWQKTARFAYDLGRFGARQLKHDRAEQMAAALAFRTLFGLLPVLVVATVLVKALGMADSYLEPLGKLFEFWGMDHVHIMAPEDKVGEPIPGTPEKGLGVSISMTPEEGAGPSEPMTLEDGPGASISLSVWLQKRVRDAEKVNFAAIGWAGVLVTLYAAISLMVTIENSFNIIYRAPQGRPWTSRVPLYWFMLTISPLVLILSGYVDNQVQAFTAGLESYRWMSTAVGILWSLLVIWILMFAVYTLFPSVRVRLRPALIGGLFAAILLELGKRTMGAYLENAISLSQLYGSLGLIPLFMFWVYLMWLAVLFGLQVSSTLQHLRGRQLAELEKRQSESAFVDPSTVIVIMQQIASQFAGGKPTEIADAARSASVPETTAERILAALVDAGLLYRLAEPETALTLSRPPEEICIHDLLVVGQEMTGHDVDHEPTSRLLEILQRAQRDAGGSTTLATLIG